MPSRTALTDNRIRCPVRARAGELLLPCVQPKSNPTADFEYNCIGSGATRVCISLPPYALLLLLAGKLPLEWVDARLVQDDPSKVLHPPDRKDLHMLPRLESALGKPGSAMDLVSPYFVPTREGTAALVATALRGVKVRVLTNSLAATDVGPVYAGYAKYREELLRGGVLLYELKPGAQESQQAEGGDQDRGPDRGPVRGPDQGRAVYRCARANLAASNHANRDA